MYIVREVKNNQKLEHLSAREKLNKEDFKESNEWLKSFSIRHEITFGQIVEKILHLIMKSSYRLMEKVIVEYSKSGIYLCKTVINFKILICIPFLPGLCSLTFMLYIKNYIVQLNLHLCLYKPVKNWNIYKPEEIYELIIVFTESILLFF